MQRVRLLRLAAIGLVGAAALTACRADPSVAVYVGDTVITEDRVQAIVDNAVQAATRENAEKPPPDPKLVAVAPDRSAVVETLVLEQLCEKYRAEKNFPPQEIVPAQIREAENAPTEAEYTVLRAKMYSCVYGIPQTELAAPAEKDLRELYDRLVAAGESVGTYEELRPQLLQNENVLDFVARGRFLTDLAAKEDITVNPRYRPLEFALAPASSGDALVGVMLGEGLTAVRPENAR